MPKSKWKQRRYLERVSKAPQPTTHFIDPKVARELPLIFGFKNLDLAKKAFSCSTGDGQGLFYVLQTLRVFSQLARQQVDIGYGNCHLIPDNQIKRHNLYDLVALSPNSKLHQLGRKQTPERVVGYFDTPHINLFQVCFLDLKHNLSGD